jgi:Mlc titration factor MtfA (ptsG expression regulator)
MFAWHRNSLRQALLTQPFPAEWDRLLRRNLLHYPLLREDQRARLQDDLRVIVAEKNWEGCGGLSLTDEMRVTIAAQAALMLLGYDHNYFDRVHSVLVYPSQFVLPRAEGADEAGEPWGIAGQAVYRGPVILAWDCVLEEARGEHAGNNVVIHEFAHQLDFLDGYVNGTPDLGSSEGESLWYEVMTAEFNRLQRQVRKGWPGFLGEYAAHSEGEFFAVASERFFMRPAALRHYHGALYAVLASYYNLDPAAWFAGGETAVDQTIAADQIRPNGYPQ